MQHHCYTVIVQEREEAGDGRNPSQFNASNIIAGPLWEPDNAMLADVGTYVVRPSVRPFVRPVVISRKLSKIGP